MNHVERFRALMNFQPVDRLPMIEWADYWGETIERWRSEGLPAELEDRFDIRGHFGLCLLYTSPSPRDRQKSRMPSSA